MICFEASRWDISSKISKECVLLLPSDGNFFLFDLGYTDVIKGLVRIGLLSPNQHPALHSQVFLKYLDRSG